MCHVKHHTFEPGNNIGAVAEHTIGLTFVETRHVVVLLPDVEGQPLGLRAFYQPAGSLQTVDIGLQFLCKCMVVNA